MKLPSKLSDFKESNGVYYKEVDRFSKYIDMDWVDDDEIDNIMSNDFEEGVKKHRSKLESVNRILEENGFRPLARFDLGEKGHFSIEFELKEDQSQKPVKRDKKHGLLGVYDTDLKTLADELEQSLTLMGGAFENHRFININYEIYEKDYRAGITFTIDLIHKQFGPGKLILDLNVMNSLIHCKFNYASEIGDEPRIAAESVRSKKVKDLVNEMLKVANEAINKEEKGVKIPF